MASHMDYEVSCDGIDCCVPHNTSIDADYAINSADYGVQIIHQQVVAEALPNDIKAAASQSRRVAVANALLNAGADVNGRRH
jgi:hypothetical protein